MTDGQDSFRPRRDRELADDLGELGGLIDRETYPGSAWRTCRWRRPRLVLRAAAGAAAGIAAAAVIVLGLRMLSHNGDRESPPRPAGPMLAASGPAAEPPLTWSVPTDINPSYAAAISFRIPSISFPSVGDTDELEWFVPSFSDPVAGRE